MIHIYVTLIELNMASTASPKCTLKMPSQNAFLVCLCILSNVPQYPLTMGHRLQQPADSNWRLNGLLYCVAPSTYYYVFDILLCM